MISALVKLERAVNVGEQWVFARLVVERALSKASHKVANEGTQQVVLVREMMVYEAGREPCFGRDRGDGRSREAVIGKHPRESSQNFSAPLLTIAGSSHKSVG